MAQKKITDLSLISSVAGTLNIPGDNGSATYRFTAAQLATYINSVLNAVQTIAAAGTALTSASKVVYLDPTSAPFTQDLPALAGWGANDRITLKNISTGANAVTLDGNAAETIESDLTLSLAAGESVTIQKYSATRWAII